MLQLRILISGKIIKLPTTSFLHDGRKVEDLDVKNWMLRIHLTNIFKNDNWCNKMVNLILLKIVTIIFF